MEKCLKAGLVKSCGCQRYSGFKLGIPFSKKYNNYDLSGDYGIGYDNNNKEFWFDLEDYDLIKNYCWHVKSNLYVETTITNSNDKSCLSLHRLVMGNPDTHVDHINHKPNDNRKENLRLATVPQNQANAKIRKDNTSGVKGVYFNKRNGCWVATIQVNKKQYSKNFNNKEDAIKYREHLEETYQKQYSYKNSMNRGDKEC